MGIVLIIVCICNSVLPPVNGTIKIHTQQAILLFTKSVLQERMDFRAESTMKSRLPHYSLATLIGLGSALSLPVSAAESTTTRTTDASQNTAETQEDTSDTLVVTAAQQNLQAPGVSTITSDEIQKRPPARDINELIRTMPGVNLTGNSTSGQRGNNRQIDIICRKRILSVKLILDAAY